MVGTQDESLADRGRSPSPAVRGTRPTRCSCRRARSSRSPATIWSCWRVRRTCWAETTTTSPRLSRRTRPISLRGGPIAGIAVLLHRPELDATWRAQRGSGVVRAGRAAPGPRPSRLRRTWLPHASQNQAWERSPANRPITSTSTTSSPPPRAAPPPSRAVVPGAGSTTASSTTRPSMKTPVATHPLVATPRCRGRWCRRLRSPRSGCDGTCRPDR